MRISAAQFVDERKIGIRRIGTLGPVYETIEDGLATQNPETSALPTTLICPFPAMPISGATGKK